jgi:hypothetical protein
VAPFSCGNHELAIAANSSICNRVPTGFSVFDRFARHNKILGILLKVYLLPLRTGTEFISIKDVIMAGSSFGYHYKPSLSADCI